MNIRSSTHPGFRLIMGKRGWGSRLVGVIAVCLLAGVLTGCVNRAPEYSIGGGVTISVPTPDGFKPLGDHDPHLRSLIESNKGKRILIEYYLTEAEYSDALHGNDTDREKDLILYALPNTFSDEQFSELASKASNKYSVTVPPIVHSGAQSDYGKSAKAIVTRPFGIFLHTSDAVGMIVANRSLVSGGVETTTRAVVMIHVRNRIVFAVVGAFGGGQSNIRWAQQIGKQWSQAILEANR